MKNKFEICMNQFYQIKDKAKLAKYLADSLNIEHSQLIEFQIIENLIKRKLTESEKDKLLILYNARDEDDNRYLFVSQLCE